MGNRNRVFSFISSFSAGGKDNRATPPAIPQSQKFEPPARPLSRIASEPIVATSPFTATEEESGSRSTSRLQTCHPPLMDVNQDTLPELQPIFSFLNSHSNKLYQEGYFLKLDDQNTQGNPNADRTWTECFAQLVGTVLSLWDAAELDGAGEEGEVLPKFINLTDASIKVIESLPTRSNPEARLQNVLSISTAGKNRYLLHFNSHHSLIQWTAGIRLAMFEHVTLQEAYTGALIAGKGKALNNINVIMERSRLPTADWARVRFGAGTPWRRCWCVISPPDEKEILKQQKLLKKKSPYDRSKPPILKGDIKFFDKKRTKKVEPIATISNAYSAFAIYPQSKPLIDASTLVKVEGSITIHSSPPSTTEGFVFVMPEVHPAVTGLEIMLRWLFPVFDTFGLYGRPGRLVAATEDVRSLMFAMPTHRRHGYLETLDVTRLILEPGSSNWKESQWRKNMKELTAKRMMAIETSARTNSKLGSRRGAQSSLGQSRFRSVQFDDDDNASVKSTASSYRSSNTNNDRAHKNARGRTDSAPLTTAASNALNGNTHNRSMSETHMLGSFQSRRPLSTDQMPSNNLVSNTSLRLVSELDSTPERQSSEDDRPAPANTIRELRELQSTKSPEPVALPPAFSHAPGSLPLSKPYHSPELRRANSRISTATLNQLAAIESEPLASNNKDEQGVDEKNILKNTGQLSGDGGLPSDIKKGQVPDSEISLNEGDLTAHQNRVKSEVKSNLSTVGSDQSLNSRSLQRKQLPLIPSQEHGTTTAVDPVSRPAVQHSNKTVALLKPLPEIPVVPKTNNSTHEDTEESLTGLLGGDFIDLEALDSICYELPPSPVDARHPFSKSDLSSFDEDDASTDSPDYASTIKSVKSRRSVDKPRAGVMRTVGEPGTETTEHLEGQTTLEIDFGPTYNYARSKSPGLSKSYGISSNPSLALKDFSIDSSTQQTSPNRGPNNTLRSKLSELKSVAPENSFAESRKVAWNPMLAGSGNFNSQKKGITPEDFVAQRANVAPIYSHQRLPSADALRTATTTPPLARNGPSDKISPTAHSRNVSTDFLTHIGHSRQSSADLLQRPQSSSASLALGSYNHISNDRISRMGHSRGNSVDLLQRPSSRAASMALGTSGSSNGNLNSHLTSHLTAREQEHLAKVTGQPLINMATNAKNVPSAGLVAALEARERDKQALKQGFNSQAVEHAIQKRQNALHQQQLHQAPMDFHAQVQQRGPGQHHAYYTAQSQNASKSPVSGAFAQNIERNLPGSASALPIEKGGSSPYSHLQSQSLSLGRQQGRGSSKFGH